MSEDPIGFGGGDQNLYRYVGNDPTNALDLTGLAALPVKVFNSQVRDREKIADLNKELTPYKPTGGGAYEPPYTDLLKNQALDVYKTLWANGEIDFPTPLAAGPYINVNKKPIDGKPPGTMALFGFVLFVDWNVALDKGKKDCPTLPLPYQTDPVRLIPEGTETTTRNDKKPVPWTLLPGLGTGKAGEKSIAGTWRYGLLPAGVKPMATDRVIFIDLPSFLVDAGDLPDKFTVDQTIHLRDVPDSTIHWTLTMKVNKDGSSKYTLSVNGGKEQVWDNPVPAGWKKP
jgi:hypothetical protein